jgi:hypothetical protein
MLTHEVAKRMLKNTLQAVGWISDKAYQRRVWIAGGGANDFDETSCYFFDNIDPVLKEREKSGLTMSQYHILKKFRDKFRNFSDKHNYEPLFIDTSEWNEIVESAKEVLMAFDCKK